MKIVNIVINYVILLMDYQKEVLIKDQDLKKDLKNQKNMNYLMI